MATEQATPTHTSRRRPVLLIAALGAALLITVLFSVAGDDSHRFGWHSWLGETNQAIAISHQGVPESIEHPDLAGFLNAAQLGFEYMETDVRLIQDDLPDDQKNVSTDDSGKVLMALHHVSGSLPTTSMLSDTDYSAPPTVFELLSHPDLAAVRWNFELKGGDMATATALDQLLDATNARDRVCISFGDIKSQNLVSQIRDELGLAEGCSCASFPEKSFFFDFDFATQITNPLRQSSGDLVSCIQILHQLITPRDVQEAHRLGIAIHAWEVNLPDAPLGQEFPDEIGHLADFEKMDIARVVELLDMGVDGIMTDNPDVLDVVLQHQQSAGN